MIWDNAQSGVEDDIKNEVYRYNANKKSHRRADHQPSGDSFLTKSSKSPVGIANIRFTH